MIIQRFIMESERLTLLFSSDSKVAITTTCLYKTDVLKHKTHSSKLDGFSILSHNAVVSVVESERIELSSKQVTKELSTRLVFS